MVSTVGTTCLIVKKYHLKQSLNPKHNTGLEATRLENRRIRKCWACAWNRTESGSQELSHVALSHRPKDFEAYRFGLKHELSGLWAMKLQRDGFNRVLQTPETLDMPTCRNLTTNMLSTLGWL